MNEENLSTGYVRAAEVAEYLGISESLLSKYRQNGTGPRYFQPGGAGSMVLYRLADVDEWIESGASSPVQDFDTDDGDSVECDRCKKVFLYTSEELEYGPTNNDDGLPDWVLCRSCASAEPESGAEAAESGEAVAEVETDAEADDGAESGAETPREADTDAEPDTDTDAADGVGR